MVVDARTSAPRLLPARPLNRAGMLFAFCDPAIAGDGESLPSTTNQLEGGTNAVVKRTLDHHRGLSEEHMKRCCEWTVYMLTEHPDPMSFVTPDYWKSTGKEPAEDDGPTPVTVTGVQLPAAGVDATRAGSASGKAGADDLANSPTRHRHAR